MEIRLPMTATTKRNEGGSNKTFDIRSKINEVKRNERDRKRTKHP